MAEPRCLPEPPGKADLIHPGGRSYLSFRAGLRPKYAVVWLHIGLAYAALALTLALASWLGRRGWPAWLLVVAGGASVGYLLAYIHLFIHEAAHYNLAPDRRVNDVLANVFIGLLVGMDVRRYRPVHFDHHRHLGTTRDPERSYFDALNWRFLLGSLTGMRVLKVIRTRRGHPGTATQGPPAAAGMGIVAAGALLNAGVIAALACAGTWALAMIWTIGLAVVFPCFAAVRQVLEHRGDHAAAAVDYSRTDHGRVTRLFGTGPLASTLGGAGFNRHLLHHWDPQLSYTRLAEAQAFLADTALGPWLREHETTYASAFARLFNH